ncbi:MAG: class I fructose-bisphosphate aldolase, partial [Acidimicrobiales bacterium]
MTANKAYRMGRIFGEDGRALVLPVDHGIMLGRVPGLEHPRRRLVELAEMGCDGFLMNRGLAAQTEGMFARRGSPARLLTVDTFWREPGEAGSGAGLVASVEDAVRLGMDGVKALMAWNVPSRERQETLSRLARLIAEADRWEVPVVVEPTSLGEGGGPMPVAMEGDAARIAMELGADIIKLSYPGDP